MPRIIDMALAPGILNSYSAHKTVSRCHPTIAAMSRAQRVYSHTRELRDRLRVTYQMAREYTNSIVLGGLNPEGQQGIRGCA